MNTAQITVVQPRPWPFNPFIQLLWDALAEDSSAHVIKYSDAGGDLGSDAIWHLHWPENMFNKGPALVGFLRAVKFLNHLKRLRRRGVRIVWTMHNIMSHERRHPRLEEWMRRRLCGMIDGWISMSAAVRDEAVEAFPMLREKSVEVIPHGHYRDFYPMSVTREAAREKLNLPADARVLVFFGAVRKYKRVPLLLRCFSEVRDEDLRLIVAGHAGIPELEQEIRSLAKNDERINLDLRFVPNEEAQNYFRAADAAILPFRDITNSGSAVLSLSFDTPIIVPNMRSMTEIAEYVGKDWAFCYDGEFSSDVVRAGADWAINQARSQRVELAELNWDRVAAATIDFYRRLLGK